MNSTSKLTLGWEVNQELNPIYSPPTPDKPSENLVCVDADRIGDHVAILAQSGGGKSFFLGRFIEEVLINTQARCVVLDPNADFCRAFVIEDEDLWTKAAFGPKEGKGKLPHECNRAEFEKLWSKMRISVRSGASQSFADLIPKSQLESERFADFPDMYEEYEEPVKLEDLARIPGRPIRPLQISWTDLAVDFIMDEDHSKHRSELFYCHEFVRALDGLLRMKVDYNEKFELFNEAERYLHLGILSTDQLRHMIESFFGEAAIYLQRAARSSGMTGGPIGIREPLSVKDRVNPLIDRIALASRYISNEVTRYYLGKAREYESAGILDTTISKRGAQKEPLARLEVIDLPSLRDTSVRHLVTNAVLSAEWNRARNEWAQALRKPPDDDERVPTFIIVDEAHNLIPAAPHGRAETALRDQFRTIVAEGRKYGLFLCIVSQRPDRLDPITLSGCANVALLRHNSRRVLDDSKKTLGLDDDQSERIDQCLRFKTGRVVLAGNWSPEKPRILYSAARRTKEGGRNLRSHFWAQPPKVEE